MVKFLHTADWHLGMKYSQLGDKADYARSIRIQSVQKVLGHSNEVDFVLVAGDLFDSNNVDRRLLNSVFEIFKKTTTPIYIIPGNHDPLTKDSLYWDDMWDLLDNVTVFKESEPFNLPYHDVIIYPSPVSQKQSKKDPTEWIKKDIPEFNDDNSHNRTHINIGLAHGNLAIEGFIDNPNFPINPKRTEISDMDYLALGEWHSLYTHNDPKGISRTVYPGTPEPTKFKEDNSGKAVMVNIESAYSNPVIEEIKVGTLIWEKHKLEINSLTQAETLHLNIQQTPNPQNRVLSLNLSGVTDQETIHYLETFPQEFEDKFMLLKIVKDNLFLKPNLLELKALLPEGSVVNQTFEALMALMKTQPELQEYSKLDPEITREIFNELRDENILEGLTPEVINRSFLLMYQLIQEASL